MIYEQLKNEFPGCKFVGVGFSLGANILVKFLGECPERQDDFVCAISVCQGYDAVKLAHYCIVFLLPSLYCVCSVCLIWSDGISIYFSAVKVHP